MRETQKEKAAAMHEATDIGTLIERVEAATGPDLNLKAAILNTLFKPIPDEWRRLSFSPTGSIDAAVSLIEKAHPKTVLWSISVPANWSGRKRKPRFEATVSNNSEIGVRARLRAGRWPDTRPGTDCRPATLSSGDVPCITWLPNARSAALDRAVGKS